MEEDLMFDLELNEKPKLKQVERPKPLKKGKDKKRRDKLTRKKHYDSMVMDIGSAVKKKAIKSGHKSQLDKKADAALAKLEELSKTNIKPPPKITGKLTIPMIDGYYGFSSTSSDSDEDDIMALQEYLNQQRVRQRMRRQQENLRGRSGGKRRRKKKTRKKRGASVVDDGFEPKFIELLNKIDLAEDSEEQIRKALVDNIKDFIIYDIENKGKLITGNIKTFSIKESHKTEKWKKDHKTFLSKMKEWGHGSTPSTQIYYQWWRYILKKCKKTVKKRTPIIGYRVLPGIHCEAWGDAGKKLFSMIDIEYIQGSENVDWNNPKTRKFVDGENSIVHQAKVLAFKEMNPLKGGRKTRKRKGKKKLKKKKTRRKKGRKKGGKKFTSKRKPNPLRRGVIQHNARQERIRRRQERLRLNRNNAIEFFRRTIIDGGQLHITLTNFIHNIRAVLSTPQYRTRERYDAWSEMLEVLNEAVSTREISIQDRRRIDLIGTLLEQYERLIEPDFDTARLGDDSSSDEEATTENID